MAPKRTLGVTVLAVFLIVSGAFGVSSIGTPFSLRGEEGRLFEPTQFKQELMKRKGISEEQRRELKAVTEDPQFEKILQGMRRFVLSREFSTTCFFYGILSALYLVIGFGIYRLQEWGRRALIGIEISSIPFKIFVNSWSANALFRELAEAMKDEKLRQVVPTLLPVFVVAQFVLFSLFAFLVVFYVTRPKIKEQFKSSFNEANSV